MYKGDTYILRFPYMDIKWTKTERYREISIYGHKMDPPDEDPQGRNVVSRIKKPIYRIPS